MLPEKTVLDKNEENGFFYHTNEGKSLPLRFQ
jgi:hypothetical protein